MAGGVFPRAPLAVCPECHIEKGVVAAEASTNGSVTITFHCPKCGTNWDRTYPQHLVAHA
jgi:hypothetical protein